MQVWAGITAASSRPSPENRALPSIPHAECGGLNAAFGHLSGDAALPHLGVLRGVDRVDDERALGEIAHARTADTDRAAHVAATPAPDAHADAHRVVLDLVGLGGLVGDPQIRVVLRLRIAPALHLGRDRSADVLVEELQRRIAAVRRRRGRPAEGPVGREIRGRITHRLRFRRRRRTSGKQHQRDQNPGLPGLHTGSLLFER